MRFRACLLPLCILGLVAAVPVKAEEKNGVQCSVQKVTLDRADVRSDLNAATLDRIMGLRVSLRNTGFKPIPEGEITWEILKRKYDTAGIELTTGTEKLQRLKAGENLELTLGSARVSGIRNGALLRQDELEWQITIKSDNKEVARFTSKSSFPMLLKRAVKVDLPAPPSAPAAPPPPAAVTTEAPAGDTGIGDLVGTWKITYANGTLRTYTFDKDGKMSGDAVDGKLTGQIEQKDGRLLLTFPGQDKLERLTLHTDGNLVVEHWNPKEGFPAKPPLMGMGPRTSQPANAAVPGK